MIIALKELGKLTFTRTQPRRRHETEYGGAVALRRSPAGDMISKSPELAR